MSPHVESAIVAEVDIRLHVSLDSLAPLRYGSDTAPEPGLPGHVQAASALRRHCGRLVIVQDDVNILALHYASGMTAAVLLPPGPDGRRAFGRSDHDKKLKMDLEACTVLPDGRLLALGSGSSPNRESIVLLDREERIERRQASAFYEGLRACAVFSGSELNVEGALRVGDEVLLFQRGNGAPRAGRVPVNAIGAIDLRDLMRWLDASGPVPALQRIIPVDLGTLAGVRLGFTDAALTHDGRVAVLACAEASADALQDGTVAGCRFGYLEAGTLRMADILLPDGSPACLKLEGIESRPDAPDEFDVVTDLDSPDAPAMLGRLHVTETATPAPGISGSATHERDTSRS